MTFIASVIARDGIAVIADSLVSTTEQTISLDVWEKFIEDKNKAHKGKTTALKLAEDEITKLFNYKSSYTKDYANKIFEFGNNDTLITTAGNAYINDKMIEKLVSEINIKVKRKRLKSIKAKITAFCDFLEIEIKEHINKHGRIATTIFIFSHYNKNTEASIIEKISVIPNSRKEMESHDTVYYKKEEHERTIICDGQNGLADRILYGGVFDILSWNDKMVDLLKEELEKLGIKEDNAIPKDFFKDKKEEFQKRVINEQLANAAYFYKLKDLSLQQAVDLAFLLLKVERDFQAYTKNVPNVGGLIKLATITKEGIKFISGKNIIKPTRHF